MQWTLGVCPIPWVWSEILVHYYTHYPSVHVPRVEGLETGIKPISELLTP